MIKYLDDLKEFGQFWYITITGFDKDLEPNVPPIEEVIQDFKTTSDKVGEAKQESWIDETITLF